MTESSTENLTKMPARSHLLLSRHLTNRMTRIAFLAFAAFVSQYLSTKPLKAQSDERPSKTVIPATDDATETTASPEDLRLELMRKRTQAIEFSSTTEGFPTTLSAEPLFRYDDITRGYLDGAVWRLGTHGRPAAIITSELSRDFFKMGPKIIYEFLSLTDQPFQARSLDFPSWIPSGSAVKMKVLPDAPPPSETAFKRLQQMKSLARRFEARQEVDKQRIVLRRLPRPIGRYTSKLDEDGKQIDGAMFVFASGRMPGLVLIIESNAKQWQYGVGRLSRPSLLVVTLDGIDVWQCVPSSRSWTQPFTSTNARAEIP